LTSDEKQPRSHAEAPAADASSDSASDGRSADAVAEPGSDDLEALAGALPSPASPSEPPAEPEENLDLGALAAVGGRRPSEERSPTPPTAVSEPSTPPVTPSPRASWVMPLVLGLALGAGVAGVVFATAGRAPPPSAPPPSPDVAAAEPIPAEPVAVAANPPATASAAAPQLAPAAAPGAATPARGAAADSAARARAARPAGSPEGSAEPSADSSGSESDAPVLAITPAEEEAAAAAAKAAAESAANAKAGPPSSVDALLDEALAPSAKRQELAYRQQAALQDQEPPLTPSKEDVTRAMTVLLPAIRGCAMGNTGLATAGIVVGNDGRVVGVEISGAPFAGTASGRCMEGVIRRARFTRFRQPTLRIKFPLAIQ